MRSAIGADVGGTKIRVARVSADGAIEAEMTVATAATPAAVLAQIDAMIASVDATHVAAIGVGVPGRVESASGAVLSGGYVDLSGPPLGPRLATVGGRVFFADNDANMALIGEARVGAARGLRHAVLLTIGTGIGGAVMTDGRIFRGRGTAGELGHITVNLDGAGCLCGRSGCLETASSGTALQRLIAAAGLAPATTAADLVAREDPAAVAIIAAWARPLRAGIDSLVAVFDPQRVLLGGGLGAAAVAALARFPAASRWYQCEVAPAELGDRAGAIGAALAALERAP